ncbi:MAG: hypothetical protein JWO56_3425 [Acidobacteria bacterium]|nr:hypothetical protein [Acidobacteriota bacterium]
MEMQLTEPERPVVGSSVKLVVGLFFAAVGVLLTLDNFGVDEAGRALRYWPVLLIAIGLLKINDVANRVLGLAAIVAGALLLAASLRLLHVSLFRLWPIALIAAGGVLVLRALGFSLPELDGGRNIWSVLTTRKIVTDGRDLHGRRLVTFLGSSQIELTDGDPSARPGEGPLVLEVLAMWGGIEIRVPPGWEVVGEVVPIMGGVDIKNPPARGSRQLVVRGLVLMAGMEAKERKPS